jgi:TonB family protein
MIFFKYLRAIVIFLVLISSSSIYTTVQAQSGGLSMEHRIELLQLEALEALNEENYRGFLSAIDQLVELGMALEPEEMYFKALALSETGVLQKALETITGYLNQADRSHNFYREGLSLYRTIESAIEREFAQYNNAINSRDFRKMESFLAEHPGSEFAQEALVKKEKFMYDEGIKNSNLTVLMEYSRQFSDGTFIEEVEALITEMVQEEIFIVVEQTAEPVGGMQALISNLKYPDVARSVGIQGVVMVQLVVEADGNIRDISVLRGIGGGCNEAAIDAIKSVQWNPGKQAGRSVNQQLTIPIRFSLSN